VNALPWVTLKSVMLATAEGIFRQILKLKLLRPVPIKILEPPVVEHLIMPVNLYRVMAPCAQEMVVPFFRSVIEIGTSINQHVQPAPPHVEVEHVDLRKTIEYRAAPQYSEVGWIISAQDVKARCRAKDRGATFKPTAKCQRGGNWNLS